MAFGPLGSLNLYVSWTTLTFDIWMFMDARP
jgi:hypothetical protein